MNIPRSKERLRPVADDPVRSFTESLDLEGPAFFPDILTRHTDSTDDHEEVVLVASSQESINHNAGSHMFDVRNKKLPENL